MLPRRSPGRRPRTAAASRDRSSPSTRCGEGPSWRPGFTLRTLRTTGRSGGRRSRAFRRTTELTGHACRRAPGRPGWVAPDRTSGSIVGPGIGGPARVDPSPLGLLAFPAPARFPRALSDQALHDLGPMQTSPPMRTTGPSLAGGPARSGVVTPPMRAIPPHSTPTPGGTMTVTLAMSRPTLNWISGAVNTASRKSSSRLPMMESAVRFRAGVQPSLRSVPLQMDTMRSRSGPERPVSIRTGAASRPLETPTRSRARAPEGPLPGQFPSRAGRVGEIEARSSSGVVHRARSARRTRPSPAAPRPRAARPRSRLRSRPSSSSPVSRFR